MDNLRSSQVFADSLLANVVTVMDERFSTMERNLVDHMQTQQNLLDTKLHEITAQIKEELERYLDREPTGGRSRVRRGRGTEEEANTDGDSERTRRDDQDVRSTILSPPRRVIQQVDGTYADEQPPTPTSAPNVGHITGIPPVQRGGRQLAISISEGVVHFPGGEQMHAHPHAQSTYIANANGPSVLIGRTVDNTIQVCGPDVSRSHFEIRYSSESARWEVKDVGSTTGTFFLLRPRQNCPMFPGLVVKIGETEFIVATCDIEASSMVLLCSEGPREGHRLTVGEAEYNIGRRANNHFVLPDDSASSHHAQITYSYEQGWVLTDLGSSNGTCIRLSPEKTPSAWHELFDEDVLIAGQTKFNCRILAGGDYTNVAV
eukprot:GEMP01050783.1.p1 GENE.GEMP01050783.1~~GEMP01050783.1.p1  ORF type:complete len:409 (+),score=57.10 GEMP01050783.1:104-1228(+)